MNQTEETLETVQKNQKQNDDRLIMLEMERTSKMLRFQNVPEKEGEDLQILMSKALATEIGMEAADFHHFFEATFRVNTAYTRRNKLPREIHVRFTKKSETRFLRASKDKQLIIEDKKINVLKQIPWQMR